MSTVFQSLTPVLYVEEIESLLSFWEQLGFKKVDEVPHGERLGFVILVRDSVQVMLQSRDSVNEDIPALHDMPSSVLLYLKVSNLEAVISRLEGLQVVVPRRKTFYGTDEIGVRDPVGNVVLFSCWVS